MAQSQFPASGCKRLHPLLTVAAVAVIVASAAVVNSSLNLWPSVGAQERTETDRAADDTQRRIQAGAKLDAKAGNSRVAQAGQAAPVPVACAQCGTIETIREVKVPVGRQGGGDQHNILGTVAGGVAGGVIGNQFGGGSGRDALTVVGAVGGALAGREIQRNMRTQETVSRHQMKVRMQDGSLRTVTTDTVQFASGDHVRFVDGRMVAR